MKASLVRLALLLLLCTAGTAARADDQIVGSAILPQTERGVFTRDGRYFVASALGIDEVKRTPDSSPGCVRDPLESLTVCRMVEPRLLGRPCLFTGMTTDGTFLYAVCTIAASPLAIEDAALFRIRPARRGPAGRSRTTEVTSRRFASPTFYNGMTALDSRTLLLTDTSASALLLGLGKPAVVKLTITDPATLRFDVAPWLASSPLFIAPNGIARDGAFVYFVGGQNLFRIPLRADHSAGTPVLIYQTLPTQLLDDLAPVGDRIAVAEIAIVNGLGLNGVTLVAKSGIGLPRHIATGLTQLSDVDVDRGSIIPGGGLIGTSFFQGGVYQLGRP